MKAGLTLRVFLWCGPAGGASPTQSPPLTPGAVPRSWTASKQGRHSNFRQRVWLPALRQAALPMIHFHDLRHTGNVLAANAGAGLRELMDRLGHSTTRAALIYLHGSDEQQRAVAEALSQLTTDTLNPGPGGRSDATGTETPPSFVKIL
jgi:hypothetical protein